MNHVETIEAVAKYAIPDYKVRVAQPFDRDCVDIFLFAYCWRGKRQRSQYYARTSISGYVLNRFWDQIGSILAVELESVRLQMDEKMEMTRLVGWKRLK